MRYVTTRGRLALYLAQSPHFSDLYLSEYKATAEYADSLNGRLTRCQLKLKEKMSVQRGSLKVVALHVQNAARYRHKAWVCSR